MIPREVAADSPIEHIIYILKENRTYNKVLGDVAKGNGDSRRTIFGKTVTPNQHALVEQHGLFLDCDGEVSVGGHWWSTRPARPTITKSTGRRITEGTAMRKRRRPVFPRGRDVQD